jgi:hypothetical protein
MELLESHSANTERPKLMGHRSFEYAALEFSNLSLVVRKVRNIIYHSLSYVYRCRTYVWQPQNEPSIFRFAFYDVED